MLCSRITQVSRVCLFINICARSNIRLIWYHLAMLMCTVTTLAGCALLPLAIRSIWLLWPLLFIWGGAAFGVYTVALAGLGDRYSGAMLLTGSAPLDWCGVWVVSSDLRQPVAKCNFGDRPDYPLFLQFPLRCLPSCCYGDALIFAQLQSEILFGRVYDYGSTIVPMQEIPEYQTHSCVVIPSVICTKLWKLISWIISIIHR